jgi:hypothetical protein
MCGNLELCPETVLHKSSLVMRIYRDVVWMTAQRADIMKEEAYEITQGRDLGVALTYLADFAPTEHKQDFEIKVSGLFETKWMVDLIDTAMLRVHDFPCYGKLYFEILSKSYMTVFQYSEPELLEIFALERSAFYDRKREAMLLLGIALWGYAIAELEEKIGKEKLRGGDTNLSKTGNMASTLAFPA